MRISLKDFENFYTSNLGQIAIKIIYENTKKIWQNNKSQNILGFGYCKQILQEFSNQDCRIINYQIAEELPNGIYGDIIGNEDRTPFEDDFFEKILCLHAFEECESPQRTLRELWRILKPEGSLILIIPNRNGAWARREETPFGHGRPYSRSQLINILNNSLFEILGAKRILFNPPFDVKILNNFSQKFEAMGSKLWPSFGGLLFFEIKKRVFIAPPTNLQTKLSKVKAFNATNFSKPD